jgi:glycine/D-amino acid oxidase-like deaminating enzyme
MVHLPNQEKSYWKESVSKSAYRPLQKNITVDVIVVGGGITGLTCAYLLKQSGLKVAVLEKNLIGSGTTGGTTGKVTSQHGLIYADLQKRLGKKVAKTYAEANQSALKKIELIIKKEKIVCDWQRQDNYVYTTDPTKISKFKTEARIAKSLGLPASFETKLALPFPVKGAVKFANQAQFNSQKYVSGLAQAVHGQGSFVFENSNVIRIRDGAPAMVKTKKATVTAENIIVASKVPAFPLIARFSYAALEYPHTSYIVAGRSTTSLKGMYISPDKGQYSILPIKNKLLLVGGENHIPGLGWPRKRHQKLANYAQEHFGVSSVQYRWKAMDYITYDKLPLVGKVYPWSKHLYTATGFKKWGLSTSMVSAMILHDTILGKPNVWAEVFTSTRFRPVLSIPRVIFDWLSSPRSLALVLAGGFLAIGVGGFIPALTVTDMHGMQRLLGLFIVDTVHNIIHIGSALLALLSVKLMKARLFLQIFGVIYGLVTVIGFIQGDSVLGLFHVNLADNLLHVVIASSSLLVGFGKFE